jgi:hypothetical protein
MHLINDLPYHHNQSNHLNFYLRMKKVYSLLAATLFLACIGVQAQSESSHAKGTLMINPQLLNVAYNSLTLKSDGDIDASQFGLAVAGGYAIQDALYVMGQVGAQSMKYGEDAYKVSFATLGAGLRYYVGQNFFVGAGLLVNTGKIDDGIDDTSTTLVGYRAEAGYAIYVTPSIAFEPSVSYGSKIAGGKIDGAEHKLGYSQFGINLGVSIFF